MTKTPILLACLAAAVLAIPFGRAEAGAAAGSGLVAAYAFDEGSGSVAHDSSGNGNDGAAANATWTSGKNGGALSFNGTDSLVSVPSSSSISPTSAVTVEAWVRPATTRSWRAVAVKEQTKGALSYGLYSSSNAGPAAIVYTKSERRTASSSGIPVGSWSHVAAVYDGSVASIYVDGALKSETSAPGGLAETGGALRIGGDTIWNEWFQGAIDDLRIYNRPLTASEIQTDMATPVGSASDATAPSVPSGLAASASTQTSVSLVWNASTDNVGVQGYGVYVNGDRVDSTSSTSDVVTGLACGTTYTFAVDAFDAAGNRSQTSSATASTGACRDTTAPTAPSGLTVGAVSATSFTLSWSASSDDVGVTGYGVYLDGSALGSTPQRSYLVSGLACGTTHTLAVDAFDAAGNRSAKTTVTATTSPCTDTQAPSVPPNERYVGDTQSSIALAWDASTDNVGVAGYRLFLNGTVVGTTTALSYTYTGLACGTSYTISIAAYDAAGNQSDTRYGTGTHATLACSSSGDRSAPSTPKGLAVSAATQSLSLSWSASTDDVGVAGYGLYRDGARVATSASTGYVFSGLSCGTAYSLGVDAYDAAGNRSATATLSATTSPCSTQQSGSAAVWMAPNGSDSGANCRRLSSAASNPDPTGASLCLTLGKAFSLSQAGDVIGVLAGSYPAQSVSGAKASPGVTVDMGITGKQASFANLGVGASTSWLTVENGRTGYGWNYRSAPAPDHVTFRNITSTSVVFVNGGSNISIVGGTIGPVAVNTDGALVLQGIGVPLTNVLVQGVDFHDFSRSSTCLANSCHAEVIRVDDGTSFLTLDGNTFESNNDPNSSTVFFGSKTGTNQLHDVTVRNNFFGDPGTAYYSINENLTGGCRNFLFEYNTFIQGAAMLLANATGNCGGLSNVVVRGNLGPHVAGCQSGITYSHNLWSDGACGTSDRTTANLGFAADGFHITSTSPARGAGDPASCPARDHDGDARPQPSGTTCDAGADEVG